MPTNLDTLGMRLRWARYARQYRLAWVCKFTGVKLNTLRCYEAGTRSTPYKLVRKLAYLYDVSILWLVEADGEPPPMKSRAAIDAELMTGLRSPADYEEKLRLRWRSKPPNYMLPDVERERRKAKGPPSIPSEPLSLPVLPTAPRTADSVALAGQHCTLAHPAKERDS